MPATITITRPNADEHIEYYARYIALPAGDDGLEAMRATGESLAALMKGVDEKKAMHRYAPGKWSVKEVVNHVCDGERVFGYRALTFARADQTPLPGFDENQWVPNADSDRRPIAEIVHEFRAVRAASLALFGSFGPEDAMRRGSANGHAISVRALAWIIAGHGLHHERLLRDRYGLGR
ncbi:MAG: DinB family protein [Candidatus Eisenbacteria bacterium]|nr:DinB family protein [Candidatus Eisenbacteria bacterium]